MILHNGKINGWGSWKSSCPSSMRTLKAFRQNDFAFCHISHAMGQSGCIDFDRLNRGKIYYDYFLTANYRFTSCKNVK